MNKYYYLIIGIISFIVSFFVVNDSSWSGMIATGWICSGTYAILDKLDSMGRKK